MHKNIITMEIKVEALLGDKILDKLIYEKMCKVMHGIKVDELNVIRNHIASNIYLAHIATKYIQKESIPEWNRLSIHNKSTIFEALIKRLYDNNNISKINLILNDLFIFYSIQTQYKYGWLYNRQAGNKTTILYNNQKWGNLQFSSSTKLIICRDNCILKNSKSIASQTEICRKNIGIQVEPEPNQISFQRCILKFLTLQYKLLTVKSPFFI